MEYPKETAVANSNFEKLRNNSYPGRGIICGLDETGTKLVQIYWIMGRSENSRNRLFIVSKNGEVHTEAADPKKIKDPKLIIYTAMAEDGFLHAVSNGEQTKDALECLRLSDLAFIYDWDYEPDKPNYTPRITSIFDANTGELEILILKKSPYAESCETHFYDYNEPYPGLGYCVTTYIGDGNPLPGFEGEPYLMPLIGDQEGIAKTYWQALNEENKISLAVKFITIKTGKSNILIKNKYEKVA